MKPLSTSISTFSDLIEEGCLYVDKTEYLYNLINAPKGQYFLSRPRRFGKSLTISTLKAVFQGRRELFKGLTIEKMDYCWKTHPIIHLNMGSTAKETVAELSASLHLMINSIASDYGITLQEGDASDCFQYLVKALYERDDKVVILVDEYDKPLLNHLGKESVKEIQSVLKSFYSVIKTTEEYQRFAFITGVSKFSKVSIFSDLNNLTDLTMTAPEATMLGYTQEELENNFDGYIDALAENLGLSKDQCLTKLKEWYNGYRFEENALTIYNPVSVMKCFQNNKISNYWFETGTPTFLIELYKKSTVDLTHLKMFQEDFSVYEPSEIALLPLLVQTGYLTIKSAVDNGMGVEYELGYPNREVSFSLSRAMAKSLSHIGPDEFAPTTRKIYQSLLKGNTDKLFNNMRILFSHIPYDITVPREKYYQSLIFFILKMMGVGVEAEVRNHIGRCDCVVKTSEHIYIIEFKLNGTAEEALQQIEDKQYALPYTNDSRKLHKIGVEFSKESRNIERWLVQTR
ncbi:MAG: ATP-binding protein [Kiritimatiellae bacterium]|jgi:hypothetical protein|nr:ATP-binding protein [Kiritimatiellia bacterium]